ncbi:MAG: hypothetical protein HF962_01460 [Sulfurovum sp.]|nr:hypothetical protein [Sulfurovum sp.]
MKWTAGISILLNLGVSTHCFASERNYIVPNIRTFEKTTEVFREMDGSKTKFVFENYRSMQPIAILKIDADQIASMHRGNILKITHLSDKEYLLRVEEKHYFKDSITIRYKCQNISSECNATATVGTTNTSMTIQTPENRYEMEARNDVAYFYLVK